MKRRTLPSAFVAALLLAACASQLPKTISTTQTNSSAAASPISPSTVSGLYPVSTRSYATTSGAIYLANINARIQALENAGANEPESMRASALAGALYHRFQILGTIVDARRALALLDRVADDTATPKLLRARAGLRTGFHRFSEAQADLQRAQPADKPLNHDAPALRSIALATGDYAALKDDLAQAAVPSTIFNELVLRGNLAVLKGDLIVASLQFYRAQQQYADSSPYPLAWLFAQQGVTLQRFDHCDRAQAFFDAALERLPGYALALDHQAECLLWSNKLDAARPIYRRLLEQTGNPEYAGALAVLESEAGHATNAARYREQAMIGYTTILAKESVTWSQHAAEFYLAIGQPQAALVQARNNLKNRRDVLSLILLARAAHRNGIEHDACDALHEVASTGLAPPELQHWRSELPTNCTGDTAKRQAALHQTMKQGQF